MNRRPQTRDFSRKGDWFENKPTSGSPENRNNAFVPAGHNFDNDNKMKVRLTPDLTRFSVQTLGKQKYANANW